MHKAVNSSLAGRASTLLSSQRGRRVLLAALVASPLLAQLLAGCGQKGPLTLPAAPASTPAAAASSPAR